MSGRAELIEGEPALRELEADWRRLAELRGNGFLTPEWFWASLHAAEEEVHPIAAVVREGGTVRGILPLALANSRLRLGGAIGVDTGGPVAAPGDEEAVAEAGGRALASGWSRRSVLHLSLVDVGARWVNALAGELGVRRPIVGPAEVAPFIDFADLTWEDYLDSRSRELRSQLGRKLRKLHREHRVVLRLTRQTSELEDDLATLYRLHDLRWRGRGGAPVFAPAGRALHGEFAAAALARGWLRLAILEVDEHPAACWYGWRLGERWSYYQAGLDPAWQRQSVGFVLFGETIRMAIEEGAREYDMLLGAEDFKLRFATGRRGLADVVLASRVHPVGLAEAGRGALRRAWRQAPEGFRDRVRALRGRSD